jgi:hypothetical protein
MVHCVMKFGDCHGWYLANLYYYLLHSNREERGVLPCANLL